jgi:hypothetical protein
MVALRKPLGSTAAVGRAGIIHHEIGTLHMDKLSFLADIPIEFLFLLFLRMGIFVLFSCFLLQQMLLVLGPKIHGILDRFLILLIITANNASFD